MIGCNGLQHIGRIGFLSSIGVRGVSTSSPRLAKDNYKLLVVGGGSGGVTISAKFAKILGASNVAIVEPNEWHCGWFV